MRITHVECWPVSMRLTEPYTIAYETIDSCPNVFVRAETDAGLTGFGCAAPDLEVTGETVDTVMAVYARVIEEALRGADPLRRTAVIEDLLWECRGNPSAVAMADMVLHDLVGKAAGLPLYQILGGFRDSMPTSITIGILPLKETVDRARECATRGFRSLKIKGGTDVEADIERMVRVREVLGPGMELRRGRCTDQVARRGAGRALRAHAGSARRHSHAQLHRVLPRLLGHRAGGRSGGRGQHPTGPRRDGVRSGRLDRIHPYHSRARLGRRVRRS